MLNNNNGLLPISRQKTMYIKIDEKEHEKMEYLFILEMRRYG